MEHDYELAQRPGTTKISEQNQYGQQGSFDRDEADLARLGKKPVLKVSPWPVIFRADVELILFLQRRFGFMSLLGFSCTILITWEGMLM